MLVGLLITPRPPFPACLQSVQNPRQLHPWRRELEQAVKDGGSDACDGIPSGRRVPTSVRDDRGREAGELVDTVAAFAAAVRDVRERAGAEGDIGVDPWVEKPQGR